MFTGWRDLKERARQEAKEKYQLTNKMSNEFDSFTLRRRALLHRQEEPRSGGS